MDSRIIGLKPNIETLKDVVDTAKVYSNHITKALGILPKTADYVTSLNRALFLSMKDQIICFDDLERAGKGLEIKDIFGIISYMKEEKNCKIVILLNKFVLEKENEKDFEHNLEKVADKFMVFAPSPKEAAKIALRQDTTISSYLENNFIKLHLVNIRIMKRAEQLSIIAAEALKNFDIRVIKQAIHTITLGVYAKYSSHCPVDITFLKNYNDHFINQVNEESDEMSKGEIKLKQKKLDFVRNYDFNDVDQLDEVLFNGIDNGFFDIETIKASAKEVELIYQLRDKNDSFSEAWDKFHGSFSDNETQILHQMYDSVMKNYEVISPNNLHSTVNLFKQLGRDYEAKQMIAHYVEHKEGDRRFWDIKANHLYKRIDDPDIKEAFENKLANFKQQISPLDILLDIDNKKGWTSEEMYALRTMTSKDFVQIFKTIQGDTLKNAISGALAFRDNPKSDPIQSSISNTVEEALTIIGNESAINKIRVNRYLK